MKSSSVIISVLMALAILLTPVYKKYSENYINKFLAYSIGAYALVRATNASVSVIQKSSLAVGVGAEANLALGEFLDPLNDITERFSDLLTISIWVLAAEKIVFELSNTDALIVILMGLIVLNLYLKNYLINKILLIFLAIKLFIPFSALISNYAYNQIILPKKIEYEKVFKNIPKIDTKTLIVNPIQNKHSNSDSWFNSEIKSFFERIGESISTTTNKVKEVSIIAKYYITHYQEIFSAIFNLSILYFSYFFLSLIILPMILFLIIREISSMYERKEIKELDLKL